MKNKTNKNGYYINNYNKIYVQGTVDGIYYRKSTKKEATKTNLAYIKKYHYEVLLKLIDKTEDKKTIEQNNFKIFGLLVIENTALTRNLNSQKGVISRFNNHLVPTFKNFALNDIKPFDIEHWQNKLLEILSSASVKKCRDLLNLICTKAYANDLIPKNPTEFAHNIKVNSKKTIPYTSSEVKLMLENAQGWFKTYLLLAFSTGLRTGELMGLQWEDINFNDGYIDLQRSISKGVVTNGSSKTKNHSRFVELIPLTLKALDKYKKANIKNEKWIFVSSLGTPFKESKTIVDHHLKPLLYKLGIEYKTLYATRHTFTSMMLNNGLDTSWVKNILGHSQSSKITEDIYYSYEKNEKIINSANNIFSQKIENEKVI